MRYGLIDSGLGMLATATAILDLDSSAELVLALDPDGMPYGVREPADVARRIAALGEGLLPYEPDAIVVACNTASVHALDDLRARHEPGTPVIGTVPAIKPAAATGRPFAVWATVRTTGSPYQRDLVARFAPHSAVTEVACPGFAEAVEAGDADAVARAVDAAVAATPRSVADVVLGCTHYPLAADLIAAAFGRPVRLHDSAAAVAAQAVRRATEACGASVGERARDGRLVAVIESGRLAGFPERALAYRQGRRLAALAGATAALDRPAV